MLFLALAAALAIAPRDPCADITPGPGAVEHGVEAGNRIGYCSTEITVAAALMVKVQLAVDGAVLGQYDPNTCILIEKRVRCYVTVPAALLTVAATPGLHSVVLKPVNGEAQEPLLIATGCPALNTGVSPWAVTANSYLPVGSTFGQINQMAVANFFASRTVAALAGYVVEWRVQLFANSSLTTDRRFIIGGRCVGTPQ